MESEPKLDPEVGTCDDLTDEGGDGVAVTLVEALGGVGFGVLMVFVAVELDTLFGVRSGFEVLLLMAVLVTLISTSMALLNRAPAATAGPFVARVVVVGKIEYVAVAVILSHPGGERTYNEGELGAWSFEQME